MLTQKNGPSSPVKGNYEIDSLASDMGVPGRVRIRVTSVQSLGYGGVPYAVVAVDHDDNELIYEQDVWEQLNATPLKSNPTIS